jgi:serine/threonine protein kinase
VPSKEDVAFAKKALAGKLASKEQLQACLVELKKAERAGRVRSLVEIAIERGLLGPEQVAKLGFAAPAGLDQADLEETTLVPAPGREEREEVPPPPPADMSETAAVPPPPPETAEAEVEVPPVPPEAGEFEVVVPPAPAEGGEEPLLELEPAGGAEGAKGAEESDVIDLQPEAEAGEGPEAFLPELELEGEAAAAGEEVPAGVESPGAAEGEVDIFAESFQLDFGEGLEGAGAEAAEEAQEPEEAAAEEPELELGAAAEEAEGGAEEPGRDEAEFDFPLADLEGEEAARATDEVPAVAPGETKETALFPRVAGPNVEDSEAIPLPLEPEEEGGEEEFRGGAVGPFRLGPVLWTGAFGGVHRGKDTRSGEKVLLEAATREELGWLSVEMEARLRTARAAGNLNHRNIAKVVAGGWEGDRFYVAFDLPDGQRLPDYLHERVMLSAREGLSIVYQVTSALAAAEKKGILHEDLRPANIWVQEDGSAKVLHFGFPLPAELGGPRTRWFPMSLNRSCFLAPEVCEGGRVDARSAIYALGVTFYYIVTGRYPVMGETYVSTAFAHLRGRMVDPRYYSSEIPENAALILLKMLARHPGERYQNFRQVIDDLELNEVGRNLAFARTAPESLELLERPEAGEPVFCIVRGRNRGVSFTIEAGKDLTIGRDSSRSRLPVLDGMVSRLHCKIENRDGEFWCEDAGSSNGTFLNGQRLTEPVALSFGDRVRLGATEILYGRAPLGPDSFHFARAAESLGYISAGQAQEVLLEVGERESQGKRFTLSRMVHLKGYVDVDQLHHVVGEVDDRLLAYDRQQERLRREHASVLTTQPESVALPEGTHIMRTLLDEFLFCECCGALIYGDQVSTGEAERIGNFVFCPACAVHSTFLGERIGDLLLLNLIGTGRLGNVYQAITDGSEAAAVKMVHHHVIEVAGAIEKLRERVGRLQEVEHENLARVGEMLQTGNTYAIQMELAGKVCLDDLIYPGVGEAERSPVRWPASRALEVVSAAGRGLGQLHRAEIVHGGVAPSKIVFSARGEVRLVGGGLGTHDLLPADVLGGSQRHFTAEDFAAPEVVRGGAPDALSDQYALGAVAWVLLMARPFDPKTGVQQIEYKESGVPPSVAAVIAQMIHPKPADRYESMDRVLEALDGLRS